MQQNWIEAQNNPEIGLHYMNTLGEVIEIVTTTNVHESKEFKEHQMGVRVRTDKEFKKEHPEYVSFKGHPVPPESVPVFTIASPSFLKDCPEAACHLAPPNLVNPVVQHFGHCNILFLDKPMFQCHRCEKHRAHGCGQDLKVGDFIKVDGIKPAMFVKGKVWYFTAVRIDHTDHTHKCGVGIVKCFATQCFLVANRIGVVTEIVERLVTTNRTINLQILCKYAKVRFVDSTMPQYQLKG
jgi:hypothetical protein